MALAGQGEVGMKVCLLSFDACVAAGWDLLRFTLPFDSLSLPMAFHVIILHLRHVTGWIKILFFFLLPKNVRLFF